MYDHQTDYLITGAGAVGMAFADTLLSEMPDAKIAIVDRLCKPGGHWNNSYSYVRLDAPSAFYGVNSLPLGSGIEEADGANLGNYELASGPELVAYFDNVMQRRLLKTGRVQYFPMTEHMGNGLLRSILTGEEIHVNVRKKYVDAHYQAPSIPMTNKRNFSIDPDVDFALPHELPNFNNFVKRIPDSYVVVGAGKTAMDVCIWLLNMGVAADTISWVSPRDSWLINRRITQPGMEFFYDSMGGQAAQIEAFAEAESIDDLFDRLECAGVMLRISPKIRPSMFHYATISTREVELLQTIKNIIRLGRVHSVQRNQLILSNGKVSIPPNSLIIDCTASAVRKRPIIPTFKENRIVCQIIKAPHATLSAAITAYTEVHYSDQTLKNTICNPVPIPDCPEDYLRTMLANFRNKVIWDRDPLLRSWIRSSRLDGFGKIVDAVPPDDEMKMSVLNRIRSKGFAAAANLGKLIS